MNTFLFNAATFGSLDLGILFCCSCLLILLASVWMFRMGGSAVSWAQSGLRAEPELSLRHSCIAVAACSASISCFLLFMNSWWSFTSERYPSPRSATQPRRVEPWSPRSDGWLCPVCHRICGAQPSSGSSLFMSSFGLFSAGKTPGWQRPLCSLKPSTIDVDVIRGLMHFSRLFVGFLCCNLYWIISLLLVKTVEAGLLISWLGLYSDTSY